MQRMRPYCQKRVIGVRCRAMRKMTGKQCEKCGYELTGLNTEGRCPECGTFYNAWSGEGIGGGPMQGYRRGDWAVRLFQTLALVFAALVLLGIGAVLSWKASWKASPLIFTGFLAAICLASAVATGLSLRKL